MESILATLEQIKTMLILDHVFLGIHGAHLKFVEDLACKTLWTNAEEIGYNPNYIASLSKSYRLGMVAREVFHVAAGHCFRGAGKDPQIWSEACDYATNPVLLEMGLFLPPGVLFDKQYLRKTPEEIYYLLKQAKQQPQPQPKPQPKPQQGEEEGDGVEERGDADEPSEPGGQGDAGDDPSDDDGESEQESEGQSGKYDENSDGEGKGDPSAVDVDGAAKPEQPEPLISEIRQNTKPGAEAESKEITKVAVMQAKQRSQLSAGLKRMVKEVLQSPVDWIPLTHLFVQQIAPTDYSWRRPNRTYLHQGFYVPSLSDNQLGPLFFGNDTSGSVSNFQQDCCQKMLQDLVAETRPVSLTVIHCDCQVTKVEEFMEGDTINISPVGGGSTDFRPVFDEIERRGDTPAGLIFLTDMAGTFPAVAPDYPVLWLSTTPNVQGPFGETVYLDLRKH